MVNELAEMVARMDLEPILRVLKSGEEVKLADIARKLGVPEQEAEQAIVAALTANPSLGSFNAFSGTFARAGDRAPIPPAPPVKKKKPKIRVSERSRWPRLARVAGTLSLVICGAFILLVTLSIIGTGGTSDGQFDVDGPRGIAVNGSGYVYVTDPQNHRVQVFTADGQFVRKWGTQGSAAGQFRGPYDIAINATGHVFVADTENNRIQVFTPTGDFLLQWGITSPWTIAINSSGYVFVGGTVYTPTGQAVGSFNSGFSGLAINGTGHMYVGRGNGTIQVYTGTGELVNQWGEEGNDIGQFNFINGIAIDNKTGYVYVIEANNQRVQAFTASGQFITVWGSRGIFPGQVWDPQDIAVCGNPSRVYVTEHFNSRVQVFTPDGQFIIAWGSQKDTIVTLLIVGMAFGIVVTTMGYLSRHRSEKQEERRVAEEDAKRRADEETQKKAATSLDEEFKKWGNDGRKI